ncbi:molybdenum cofactor guanylyltransferase MobA [Vreelandella rituensis]|uniref:Molybdenum cofactor guanylyltransferase n=1 Tax=Vreelandella rituensis TaxID=2282306 RepID=A0A368TXS5_9GAMM|nr:molybdenum cofactor guanylyltransferase MobA [Halomonas rituensis]RCV89629.1 molybdenum cofactor guanylyltransferase [Halomonas rituensis]
MISRAELTGLILAGGKGRRMGGRDKGLELFAGQPFVAHVQGRLADHVSEVLINANRNLERYADFGDRVIVDSESGFLGPLMGIYTGLRAASTPWVVVTPCDTPVLPMDLVARLVNGIGDNDIAVADDGERLHPVVALIRTTLIDDLEQALSQGERKVERWQARHAWCRVDVSDCAQAFINLNSEADKHSMDKRNG